MDMLPLLTHEYGALIGLMLCACLLLWRENHQLQRQLQQAHERDMAIVERQAAALEAIVHALEQCQLLRGEQHP